MATFTDNFDGTTGTKLTATGKGWVVGLGEDCLDIFNNKPRKLATSVTTSALFRPDDGATLFDISVDLNGSTACGLLLFASVDGGLLNGYALIAPNATAFRIYRITNSVVDTGATLNLPCSGFTGFRIVAKIVGGSPNFEVTQNGTAITPQGGFTDTNSAKKTGSRRGLLGYGTGGSSTAFDNYVDNSSVPAVFNITPRPAPFCEGVLGASRISHTVNYGVAPTSLEARVVDTSGSALSGYDWSVKVSSPGAGSSAVVIDGVPLGGPYTLHVRDSGNPTTVVSSVPFWCGAVIPINDQSIHQIMADAGKTPSTGALTSAADCKVFVLAASTRLDAAATPSFYRLNVLNAYGSGYMAMADQIAADWSSHIPIMFVDIAFSGCSMDYWIDDRLGSGSTWPLRTGFATTMFRWVDYRITALIRPIVVNPGSYTIPAAYDALIALYDPLLVNQPGGIGSYQVWVPPVQRASRPWGVGGLKNLREGAYQVATRGGRWKLLSAIHTGGRATDDGDIHQASGASYEATGTDPVAHRQGNQAIGRFMGRGVVSLLQTMLNFATPVDRLGVRIAAVDFTDSSKSAIKVTFDRAVRTPAGTTVSLPQNWVTLDGWTSKDELLGTLQSDQRSVICSNTSGKTWTLNLRYDYCRDTPWDTTGGAFGGELTIQPKLDTLLHDTTSFNLGRGMPVLPEVANGLPVALPLSIAPTNATGSVTLRVRRA